MKRNICVFLSALLLIQVLWSPVFAGAATSAKEPSQKSKTETTTAKTAKGNAAAGIPKGMKARTDVPAATTPIIEVDKKQPRLLVRYQKPDKNDYVVYVYHDFAKKGKEKYSAYPLYAINADEYFPLAHGNREYKVMIARKLENGTGSYIANKTVKLSMKDQNAAFLASHSMVAWQNASNTTAYAKKLSKKTAKGGDITDTVYQDIINSMHYDYAVLGKLPSGYIPDLDTVLKKRKGVCLDTSALMVAMLRYAGVPTRLAVGKSTATGGGDHAWIEVYRNGKWQVLDPTTDAVYLQENNIKTNMVKKNKDYIKTNQF